MTERDAAADLRQLGELELLPPGAAALARAYRLLAREMDRAEREGDRWGKIGAARELRATRERLGALVPLPADGDELEGLFARLSAEIRDTPPT